MFKNQGCYLLHYFILHVSNNCHWFLFPYNKVFKLDSLNVLTLELHQCYEGTIIRLESSGLMNNECHLKQLQN